MANAAATAVAVVLLLLAAAADAIAKPGRLDKRYAGFGVARTGLLDGGFAGRLDRGGRLLVAGGISQPGVARFRPGGRRDRRFGRNGVASDPRTEGVEPFGLRRDRRRRIRVAAKAAGEYRPPMEMLRFGARGRTMPGFVHDAILLGPIMGAVQRPDGGAYVITLYGAIRAVDPDGTLDETFGGGTVELTSFFDDDYGYGFAIGLRRDGGIVAGGSFYRTGRYNERNRLVQLTPDGRLDPAFGTDGARETTYPAALIAELRGGDLLAVDATGRQMTRFSRAGVRRRGFGNNGDAFLPVPPAEGRFSYARWLPRDVVEDRRGRIYLLNDSLGGRPAILAVNRAGRRVRAFGRRGRAFLPGTRRTYDFNRASDLLLDGRGGLYVVGMTLRNGAEHPTSGCGYREDFCAAEDAVLSVWRYDR